VIYSSVLFTYTAKYFETSSGEIWRSFANSLRNMLKLRSTVHEIAWKFNNLVYSSFRSLFSLNRLFKRTELY